MGQDWHSFTALEKPDAISTQRSQFRAPCGAFTRLQPLQRWGPGSPGSWGHRASLSPPLGHQGAGPNLSEVGGAMWGGLLSSSPHCPASPTPNLQRNSSRVASQHPALGVAEGQAPAVPSRRPLRDQNPAICERKVLLYFRLILSLGKAFPLVFSKKKYRTLS